MKKFLLSLMVTGVLTGQTVMAQFNLAWDATFTHTLALNYSNESRKIAADASGNIFVLADATSDIDPGGTTTTSTYHYSVIMKYDASGTFIKKVDMDVNTHLVTGLSYQSAYGLELDASGNVFIGFNFHDPNTGSDVWAAKFDNNLDMVWIMKYNPNSQDYGVDMKVDFFGNVFIACKSVTGSSTEYHILKSEFVNYTLESVQQFDANLDVIRKMVIDDYQNVYVTGFRMVLGFANVMTASIDNIGTLRWKSIYNGGSASRDDFGTGICFGLDGYLYVTGTSDQGPPNNNDFLAIQYYPVNGKKTWITFHHYGGNDNGIFVANIDPTYIYVGSTSGNNTVLLTRIKTLNGVLSGNFVYQPEPSRPFTSITNLTLADLKVSVNNNFYITGRIIAQDTVGQTFSAAYFTKLYLMASSRNAFRIEIEEPAPGEFGESYEGTGIALNYFNDNVIWMRDKIYDYAVHTREAVELLDFTMPSQIRMQDLEGNGLQVEFFPNPAHDKVMLNSNEAIDRIEITDISGKTVKTIQIAATSAELNVSGLPAGMYIIQVYTVTGSVSHHRLVRN